MNRSEILTGLCNAKFQLSILVYFFSLLFSICTKKPCMYFDRNGWWCWNLGDEANQASTGSEGHHEPRKSYSLISLFNAVQHVFSKYTLHFNYDFCTCWFMHRFYFYIGGHWTCFLCENLGEHFNDVWRSLQNLFTWKTVCIRFKQDLSLCFAFLLEPCFSLGHLLGLFQLLLGCVWNSQDTLLKTETKIYQKR